MAGVLLVLAIGAVPAVLMLRILWQLGSLLRDARAYLRTAPPLPRRLS